MHNCVNTPNPSVSTFAASIKMNNNKRLWFQRNNVINIISSRTVLVFIIKVESQMIDEQMCKRQNGGDDTQVTQHCFFEKHLRCSDHDDPAVS